MSTFKIGNFCHSNNELFKKYYNYLNNPFYVSILLKCLEYIEHERVKNKIYNMIIENHSYILDKLNKIDIIISFYEQNNLINKSEIGKFFKFYIKNKKGINVNNNDHLLKLFYKLILYDKCISVLKECFYIFSDYRACIYFLTPSINFNNTKESIINNVIENFKDNTNTLTQIISKVYLGDKNKWGSIYYSTAYAMFETLIIIRKYCKDDYEPLKKLEIEFKLIKKCDESKILNKLCKKFNNKKLNETGIKNINNVSDFLIKVKKLGYDMWFTINLIFDTIFENYTLSHFPESETIGHEKIYYQKLNNRLGILSYILVISGYISNVNIFENFNI